MWPSFDQWVSGLVAENPKMYSLDGVSPSNIPVGLEATSLLNHGTDLMKGTVHSPLLYLGPLNSLFQHIPQDDVDDCQ